MLLLPACGRIGFDGDWPAGEGSASAFEDDSSLFGSPEGAREDPGAQVSDGGMIPVLPDTCLPGPELCNSIDDDCDGTTDEGFDLLVDSRHCGRCDNACFEGLACESGRCVGVERVAAGALHSCAQLTSGQVACWGYGTSGQLGNGSTDSSVRPVLVTSLDDAIDVSAGDSFTCSVRESGRVACWGINDRGQLGVEPRRGDDMRTLPVAVPGLLGVAQVATGEKHACAVQRDGDVVCWGDDSAGQLGRGTSTMGTIIIVTSTPDGLVAEVAGLRSASRVCAGRAHSCALLRSGAISCWGENGSGQLGIGTTRDSDTPRTVPLPLDATHVACAANHSCAVLIDGSVACWGENSDGQLGDGTTQGRTLPVPVAGLSSATQVATGESSSCALRGDGTVLCWGDGSSGQLGNDASPDHSLVPVMAMGIDDATQLAPLAGRHVCVLRGTGSVQCWGDNDGGQLGDATVGTDRALPTSVLGLY